MFHRDEVFNGSERNTQVAGAKVMVKIDPWVYLFFFIVNLDYSYKIIIIYIKKK